MRTQKSVLRKVGEAESESISSVSSTPPSHSLGSRGFSKRPGQSGDGAGGRGPRAQEPPETAFHPVSFSLSFSSSFPSSLSLSPHPLVPPHTPCFCSPPVLCNYRSSCLEHCLPRASFRPLLKRYAFSETFPELE